MTSSFMLDPPLDLLLHHPRLHLFSEDYKVSEKAELIERVKSATGRSPLNFSDILSGVLHRDFKANIYDAELLQRLKESVSFFALYPSFAPKGNKHLPATYWQEKASKLEELVAKESIIPLLRFPPDILFEIMAKLSLQELSRLNQALSFKIGPKTSKNSSNKTLIESPIRDVFLSTYPSLILEASGSSNREKIHTCNLLYAQWEHADPAHASRLASCLAHPKRQRMQSYYLKHTTHRGLFQRLLTSEQPKSRALSLDIAAPFYVKDSSRALSIASPFNPSIYWDRLVKAYAHIEELTLITAIYHLTENSGIEVFFNTLNRLSNIKDLRLKIYNFLQQPRHCSKELHLYYEFLGKFQKLELLNLTVEKGHPKQPPSPLPPSTPSSLLQTMALQRHLVQLRKNLESILNPQLSIQRLEIAFDCFSSFHKEFFEEEIVSHFSSLIPVLLKGFSLPRIREIRFIFPMAKPLNGLDKITRAASIVGAAQMAPPAMQVIDNKLTLIFTRVQ